MFFISCLYFCENCAKAFLVILTVHFRVAAVIPIIVLICDLIRDLCHSLIII